MKRSRDIIGELIHDQACISKKIFGTCSRKRSR